jgi:hypothetical protein
MVPREIVAEGNTFPSRRKFYEAERRRLLKICVSIANIANEFNLGLVMLRAYNASVGVGRQILSLAEDVVSLWNPRNRPQPSRLVAVKGQAIPAHCQGAVMARLESSFGVKNVPVETSPEPHPPRRTLYRYFPGPGLPGSTRESPECYPSRQEANISIPLAHCETHDVEQTQV